MTYSRGGLLALMTAVFVMTLLGGKRLRGLAVLGATIVALIPVLALAFSRPALKGINIPLDERTPDGIILALVMAGSLLGLLIAAWGMLRLEERAAVDATRARASSGAGSTTIVAVFGLIVVLGIATVEGRAAPVLPRRLARVHEDEPGQGLRPDAAHLVELRQPLGVVEGGGGRVERQAARRLGRGLVPGDAPHVPPGRARRPATAQRAAAVPRRGREWSARRWRWARSASSCSPRSRAIRAMAEGRERDIAVALFAGACAWLVHGVVDFDWDIPGITIPALLFMGVLVAVPASRRGEPSALPAASPDGGSLAPRVAALGGRVRRARARRRVVAAAAVGELEGDGCPGGHDAGGRARAAARGRRGRGGRAAGSDGGRLAARRGRPRAEPRAAARRAALPARGGRPPALQRHGVAAAHAARADDRGPAGCARCRAAPAASSIRSGRGRLRWSASSCCSACPRAGRRRRPARR